MARFFGMEKTIRRVANYLQHAARKREEPKQTLYLLRPVGVGKLSLAERLKPSSFSGGGGRANARGSRQL